MKTALLFVLLALPLHAAPITTLAFAPDGSSLVSGGDRTVDMRSTNDAGIVRRLDCDLPRITSIAFSPSGSILAVGGGEPGVRGEVQLFSWPEGRCLHRISSHADLVTGIAFSADGTRLGAASADHTATVCSIASDGTPAELFKLRGHSAPVLALAFGPNCIVTGSADRSLKVWSSKGELQRTLSQHTEAILALAFRPGTATCASAGDDRSVRAWQPEIGRMVRIVRRHEGSILALAWTPDGSALFSAGSEGIIRRLDPASDRVEQEWQAHDDWIYALAVSPDGQTLASADWKGTVKFQPLKSTTR
jgi:WD40 repeat protein